MCEIHANGIACIYMGAHINARTHGQATIHYLCLPCSVHAMRWRIKHHLINGDKTLPPQKAELNYGSGMCIPGCRIKIFSLYLHKIILCRKALKNRFKTHWWNLDNVTRCFHGDQKPVLSPSLVTAFDREGWMRTETDAATNRWTPARSMRNPVQSWQVLANHKSANFFGNNHIFLY